MTTVRNEKGQFVKGYTPEGSVLFYKGFVPWNKGIKRPDITGDKSPVWKGGRTLHQGKYWLVLKPEHPYADKKGYVREHRLVMENKLGRILDPVTELVHHINHNTLDNRAENLELVTRDKHITMHRQELYEARWSK